MRGSGWRRRARCYDGRPFSWRGNPVDGLMALSSARNASRAALHFVRAGALRRAVARRRPGEDAARRAHHRRDELRSAFASDAASDGIIGTIFDAMLDYDYLARPVKLVPRTLEAMPTVEDGGTTYLCKVRKGIFFTPDPAFKGKPRELTAADYAYGLKRMLDPAVKSPVAVAARRQDRRAATRRARRRPKTRPLRLRRADRRPRGRRPLHAAHPPQRAGPALSLRARGAEHRGAVAREVVEAYGRDIGAHPVGTGPYMLGEYRRSATHRARSRIPTIATRRTCPPGRCRRRRSRSPRRSRASGCRSSARVEINVIEEGQARWLAFLNRELDFLDVLPAEFIDQALDATASSSPTLAARGHPCTRCCCGRTRGGPTSTWRTRWSAATRRRRSRCAARSAWATTTTRRSACCSKAARVPAQRPDSARHRRLRPDAQDAARSSTIPAARARAARPVRLQGSRRRRLSRDAGRQAARRSSAGRRRPRRRAQSDELWKKNMDAIGIRLAFKKDQLPELRKMAREGKIPMRSDGWNADYPDAENFMQLLYGPNVGQDNHARFNLPEFDKLYDEARTLPDSPERTAALRPDDGAGRRLCAVALHVAPARGQRPRIRGWERTCRIRSGRSRGSTSTSTGAARAHASERHSRHSFLGISYGLHFR